MASFFLVISHDQNCDSAVFFEGIAPNAIENPLYKAGGECVEVDLDSGVLHIHDGM
jgi:hypothetical protein